jgi:hypothetical protein
MMNADCKTPSKYRSFLLRLWSDDAGRRDTWRIVLISPKTGERNGFVDFQQLVEFLKRELDEGTGISKDAYS